MPTIFTYFIKLSLSLAIIYLFYQLVLRRMTFFNHNRWYLLGYSVLCFFIAMVNITPVLEKGTDSRSEVVAFIPTVEDWITPIPAEPGLIQANEGWTTWNGLTGLIVSGIVIFFFRLLIQLRSFIKIRKNARLIIGDEISFYQVDRDIIPFSFGNSIFVNQHLHSESELKEIIRHEFVHIRQKHTVDIFFSELLCIINWYNPFAWLIRIAIRQNLEFIADNKVLENGADKKQYQYLLLKVIGNNQFSIASNFNFSSLKKRIFMMNKLKTTKAHMLKMLFMLPLIFLVLLAFRNKSISSVKTTEINNGSRLILAPDTIPGSKRGTVDVKLNVTNVENADNFPNNKNLKNKIQGAGARNADNAPNKNNSMDVMTFIADTINWSSADKVLTLKGKAVLIEKASAVSVEAELINIHPTTELLIIDGREAILDKDYTGKKGSSYQLKKVSNEDALKKYGEKGRNGAIEIKTLPEQPIQLIEQKIIPVFDIRSLVAGKKKDDC